jgi:hypothetical protein
LPANRAHRGGRIVGGLKKVYRRYACGSRGHAVCDVGGSDAADSDDGNIYRTANFGETVKTLWSAIDGFGGRCEDGPEENVVSAFGGRKSGGFERVAGNTDEKIRRQRLVSAWGP